MLFYNGKQYIEGIDGIDLMLQQYLYPFLDLSIKLDKYNKLSLLHRGATFNTSEHGIVSKSYFHLHISGEYINPKLPLKDTFANAIHTLFFKRIIKMRDYNDRKILDEVTKEKIKENLHLFITGISGMEFCFDFEEKNVKIAEDVKSICTLEETFSSFLNGKLKDRQKCLIEIGLTRYSNDYNKARKSTIKLYNREEWLKKRNNEFTFDFIDENPYEIRLEFVFKKNKNTSYLSIDNFDGNYQQVIEKFIPYLAKLFKKYFLGKVKFLSTSSHKYFNQIYALAHNEKIENNKLLKNTRYDNYKYTDKSNYFCLIQLLRREARNREKLLKLLPDEYFAKYYILSKLTPITPFDYLDEEKILFREGDFIFFKDQMVLPEFKTIDTDIN